jgi:hypothetical protein
MLKMITAPLSKDVWTYPKFRHNLWTTYDDKPEVTYLTVSHSTFEVPRRDADTFLRLRTFCTGHHTMAEIAHKSGVDAATTQALLTSLLEAEVGRPAPPHPECRGDPPGSFRGVSDVECPTGRNLHRCRH